MTENVKHVEEALGCFEAAEIEGWSEALRDGDIDRIRDLWQRRISYAIPALEIVREQLQREAVGDGEGVYVDFPKIGKAGPFVVVDGVLTVPNATMCDLYAAIGPHPGAPRPTGTACNCAASNVLHEKTCASLTTPASAEPGESGCVIRLGVDDWNPYELLDIARLHVPANDLLLDRIKECLRQQRTVQSNPEARGGGEAECPNCGAPCNVEHCVEGETAFRRYTYAHPTPAALDAEKVRATDEEIAEWVERHWLAINGSDARACFEDAQSVIAARATTGASE